MERRSLATDVKLAETHLSIVCGDGEYVTKVKKPVRTDFIDLRTRAQRRKCCEREIALNRRLSPDVYVGVIDIAGEPAVRMRQLPAAARLSRRLDRGDLAAADMESLARKLAVFHERAERSAEIDQVATPPSLLGLWRENLAAIGSYAPAGEGERIERIGVKAASFIEHHHKLFTDRIAGGHICDGHGDLLADDIYILEDGPRILDCLEFDDHLRWGDVMADIAFLVMDLEARGHRSEADLFVAEYRRLSGDKAPGTLLNFYVAYRALVRAKVAYLRQNQRLGVLGSNASDLTALCERRLAAAQPRLILVGGIPGSGKSTVSQAISRALDISCLSTDDVRHDVLKTPRGHHQLAALDDGAYAPEVVAATYGEVLAQAGRLLERGYSVVLDATWRSERNRAKARTLAASTGSYLVEIQCVVSLSESLARVTARDPATTHSDATAGIAVSLARSFDPWPAAFQLNAGADSGEVVAAAIELIEHGRAGVAA